MQYKKGKRLGGGEFGEVYYGIQLNTNRDVALKKVKKMDDGIDFSALREIRFLQEIKSPYIMELLDVFFHQDKSSFNNIKYVYLVYEYIQTDLEKIILDRKVSLTNSDIKVYLQMLLKGLKILHNNWIIHRDIKPGNLLVSSEGYLKIGDFGFSKKYAEPETMRFSPNVVTIWYRSPELLYGADIYGPGVDIWSAGCVFAELMLRSAFFGGDDVFDQLSKIFYILGTPTTNDWNGMELLPNFVPFTKVDGIPLKSIFINRDDSGLDLLVKMLKYDPRVRITSDDALRHPYFTAGESPTLPENLVLPKSMLEELRESTENVNQIISHS